MKYENSIRVFLPEEAFERLLKWADYHGFSLSKACRVIIDSAPLNLPEEIDEDEKPTLNDFIQ